MTYTAGSEILAADYNTFAGNTTAGLNRVWSTGAGDAGWGQTDIATVAAAGTVTATQWATIVNNLATSGTQTGTTLTPGTSNPSQKVADATSTQPPCSGVAS